MTSILINIDHVGTLRNARGEAFPDPVEAAATCEAAGADGIVFHLREDRRHIKDRDVRLLKETVRGRLDFELSVNVDIVEICCRTVPNVATLVPERREELTTEGGLDVVANSERVSSVVDKLQAAGIEEVALFVDPDLVQIEAAAAVGANCIELHTGDFANATARDERQRQCELLSKAGAFASQIGLHVHAGHGLSYDNYREFAAAVPQVAEVSIGFAVISRAVFVGLDVAVREICRIVRSPHT